MNIEKNTIAVIGSLHKDAQACHIAYEGLAMTRPTNTLLAESRCFELPSYAAILDSVEGGRFTYGVVPAPPAQEVVDFWLKRMGGNSDMRIIAEESFPYLFGEPPRTFHLVSKRRMSAAFHETCKIAAIVVFSGEAKESKNIKDRIESYGLKSIATIPFRTSVREEHAWYIEYETEVNPVAVSVADKALRSLSKKHLVLGTLKASWLNV